MRNKLEQDRIEIEKTRRQITKQPNIIMPCNFNNKEMINKKNDNKILNESINKESFNKYSNNCNDKLQSFITENNDTINLETDSLMSISTDQSFVKSELRMCCPKL